MISFDYNLMKPGTVLVVCGPQGCGKSSLAHILAERSPEPIRIMDELTADGIQALAEDVAWETYFSTIVTTTLEPEHFSAPCFTTITIGGTGT